MKLILVGLLVASALTASGLVLQGGATEAREGSVLVGIQGAETAPGGIVSLDGDGRTVFETYDAVSYHSVERMENGHIVASFLDDGYQACGPYEPPCPRTGFRIFDPETGDLVREWTFPVRTTVDSEVHDTEPLPSGEMLVVDMDRERVLTVAPNGTVTWQWNASEFYTTGPENPTREDWLHMNDVDRVGEGRYLVSVRNANQLLVIERGEGVVEVVNGDRDPDVMYHQHNPQLLNESRILVADSENDRIVELEKRDGDWEVAWELREAGGQRFNWPRDADRLPNGHTVVTDSRNNRVLEVDESGAVVWIQPVPNLPYEADRLPYNEPRAGAPLTSPPNEAETSPVPGVAPLESGMGLLRHAVSIPFWMRWWHLLGYLVSGMLVVAGGVRYPRSVVMAPFRSLAHDVVRSVHASTDHQRYLAAMVCAGVTLLLSAPISWNYFDVHLFMLTWSDELQHGWNVYETGNPNYPPLSTYLFVGLELLARMTAGPTTATVGFEPIDWVRVVTRLPLIAGFTLTAKLMYDRWGWSTARYWLLTPPTLVGMLLFGTHPGFAVLSAFSWTTLIPLYTFWGYQFDLLTVPFVLLALFSLLDGKPRRFGLYLGVGGMIKFYPLVLVPLGLARFSLRDQIEAGLISLGVMTVISAPFLLTTPDAYYYQLVGFQSERFPQGLSIFHLPLLFVEYDVSAFNSFVALKWLWQVVWLPIYGTIVLATWATTDRDSVVLAFGATILSLIAFNKIGNINYFVWMWPFVLFAFDRGYLSWQLPTAMIGTVTAYVFSLQMAAAIVDEPMLIIQELEWYSARRLVVESFLGTAHGGLLTTMAYLEANYLWLAEWIYVNRFVLLPIVITVHFVILIGMLERLVAPFFSTAAIRRRLVALAIEVDDELLYPVYSRAGVGARLSSEIDGGD